MGREIYAPNSKRWYFEIGFTCDQYEHKQKATIESSLQHVGNAACSWAEPPTAHWDITSSIWKKKVVFVSIKFYTTIIVVNAVIGYHFYG